MNDIETPESVNRREGTIPRLQEGLNDERDTERNEVRVSVISRQCPCFRDTCKSADIGVDSFANGVSLKRGHRLVVSDKSVEVYNDLRRRKGQEERKKELLVVNKYMAC